MDLNTLYQNADPVILATYILLVFMSFLSWYIILWKAIQITSEYTHIRKFQSRLKGQTDWPGQIEWPDAKGHLQNLLREAQRIKPTLPSDNDHKRQLVLTTHLSQKLDMAKSSLERGISVLASIGTTAPLLGLFGTVWGIYTALTRIAAEGNAALDVVAGPMGEALTTTAIGLFAAIPAIVACNMLMRRSRSTTRKLRHIAEQLTLYVQAKDEKAV